MGGTLQSPAEKTIVKETASICDYNKTSYSKFWTSPSKSLLDKKERRIIRNLIPPVSGWFVDLGCGYGRLLPTYMNLNRQIVLVDYALNLLEESSQRYSQDGIYFIAADVYHLPFRDNVFDCGLSVRLFHHINAPQSFLNEVTRIFRKGARLVLSYSNKRNMLRIFKHGAKAFRHDHEEYSEMLFGTHPGYFAELCRNAAFRIERTRGTGFLDQFFRVNSSFDHLLGRMRFLALPISIVEDIASWTLGRMNLAPLHFASLCKESGAETSSVELKRPQNLIEILACPCCRSINLSELEKNYTCLDCGKIYPRRGRIIDFR